MKLACQGWIQVTVGQIDVGKNDLMQHKVIIFCENVLSCARVLPPQVNRPMSMRKDGIQTRKRKPKSPLKALANSGQHQHIMEGLSQTLE